MFLSIENFFGPLFLFDFLDAPNNNDIEEVKLFVSNSAETFVTSQYKFIIQALKLQFFIVAVCEQSRNGKS